MASVAIPGVDYAYGRPTPAQLVAAGVRWVGRYLGTAPGDRRAISAAEAAGYLAAGLDIVLIWEIGPDRAAGGASAGVADAMYARLQLAAIGAPDSAAVYFVVQDDGTPAPLAAIDAYLAGAGSVLGDARIGAYAGGTVIAHVKAAGTARWLWRAAAISWGPAPTGTHVIQTATASTIPAAGTIGGEAVDRDTALVADYGQWRADAPMDLSSYVPALLADIRGGATLYADPGRAVALVTGYPARTGAPLYFLSTAPAGTTPAPLVPIVDGARIGWIGADTVSNVRPAPAYAPPPVIIPTAAEVAAATADELARRLGS